MGTGPSLVDEGFPVIDQAKNHEGLVGTSVSIVTEDFLTKHPGFPQKWNQARLKALQEIQANPDVFYQFAFKASNNLPISVVKESYPVNQYPVEPLTSESLKLLGSTKQFLVGQQLLKSDFEIKEWTVSSP
jgi:NitT/TauT family transport system substrate-binding protein/sulfonate transport system substrate-binding protein